MYVSANLVLSTAFTCLPLAKQKQPLTPHALPRRNNLTTHIITTRRGSNAHKQYNPNMVYNG
jgi:hypothetical protein